jgi:purine-binding chemotaxis protein CheW
VGSPEADIDPIVASPRHQEGAAEELGLVLVSIYGVSLAVPAAAVASISVVGSPTPLPGAPPHIAGLVAAGERAMPLVDLEILLAIDGRGRAAPDPLFRRTLFVAAGGLEAGLVCHRARGLISITADALREPTVFQGKRLRPLLAAEIEARGGVVGVLDVPALLEAAAVA